MNIERSFRFAFKSPGAIGKLALGGLFSLLFFTVFFPIVVMGYMMRVLCDALEGRDAKLPDWSLGELFNEGLMPILVVLAYCSPLIALMILEQILIALFGLSIPLSILFLLLHLIIPVALSMLVPIALIRFAIKRSMKAAFDLKEIVGFIKKNKGPFFTAWGLSFAVGAVSSIGLFVFIIGLFFTNFIAGLITMHLYASAYRASTPFNDDKDGELRSSMAIPPPLRRQ